MKIGHGKAEHVAPSCGILRVDLDKINKFICTHSCFYSQLSSKFQGSCPVQSTEQKL